jgi:hypothetical protein
LEDPLRIDRTVDPNDSLPFQDSRLVNMKNRTRSVDRKPSLPPSFIVRFSNAPKKRPFFIFFEHLSIFLLFFL